MDIMDNSMYNNIAKSSAYANLDWIYNNMDINTGDEASRKHRKYLLYLINELYNQN
jgi:hypothetical protein